MTRTPPQDLAALEREAFRKFFEDGLLDIFLGLTFAVGLMFEVPVVAAFLAIVGVVRVQALIDFRRYWLLAATVIAAVITPTGDPITLAICTVPLLVLYEVGIIAVKMRYRNIAASICYAELCIFNFPGIGATSPVFDLLRRHKKGVVIPERLQQIYHS